MKAINLLYVFFLGCTLKAENPLVFTGEEILMDRKVTTVTVTSKSIHSSIPLQGRVVAGSERGIFSAHSGFVRRVCCKEGEFVSRHDTLVRFDQTAAIINRRMAAARVKRLEYEYESERLGFMEAAGGVEDALRYLIGLNEAELQLDLAEYEESRTFLLSPGAGWLSEWEADSGEYFSIGEQMGSILSPEDFEISAYFLESELSLIRTGMTGRVELPSGQFYSGRLTRVLPKVDEKGRIETRWSMQEKGTLMPGMTVRVFPELKTRTGIVIPADALAGNLDEPVVFTVSGDSARYNRVETRWYSEDSVEVVSGLNDGDRIILTNQISLHDGTRVEEISNK